MGDLLMANVKTYLIEQYELDQLKEIKSRLYDGTKLDYDGRRWLARSIEAIIEDVQDRPHVDDPIQQAPECTCSIYARSPMSHMPDCAFRRFHVQLRYNVS
jgi:hypothetical protein